MSMKVSIITPSLNQAEYIEETILSVINQGKYDIEHIIVDGKSSDGTHKVLKKYHNQGKIIWYKYKDLGQTDAINYGISKSTGEIICYLNSDDVFLPNAISRVVNVFKEQLDVQWLTGDGKIIDTNGNEIKEYVSLYKRILRNLSSYYLLGVVNYIIQPSTFWRRSFYDEVGEFNSGLNYVMDYDYWIRCWKISPPKMIINKLSAFRVHGKSKSTIYLGEEFDECSTVCRVYYGGFVAFLNWAHGRLIILFYSFGFKLSS